MQRYFCVLLFLLSFNLSEAQKVKDYFYVEKDSKELPVFVRGNMESKTIILFVQGGPGETGIDFARSDYPGWKKTLEQKVAIAYYDQRGLNKKLKKIDSTKITYHQYSQDIIRISQTLKQKYKAKIYLAGHSYGGGFVYHCLAELKESQDLIEGAVILNTPITTDHTMIRYTHYRPLYLKNLAKEFISKGTDVQKWQEAYDWMEEMDSISTIEMSRKWNAYVDSAFEPKERKLTIGMAFRVLFSRPYNPIKYLNNKDNSRVSRLIWTDQKNIDFFEILPKIEQPVLLVTGRYDDIAIPEEIQKSAELLKNSSTRIIQNAGHQPFIDQPELLNEAILKFVLGR